MGRKIRFWRRQTTFDDKWADFSLYSQSSGSTATISIERLDISSDLNQITSPLAASLCSRIRSLNFQLDGLVRERDDLQKKFIADFGASLKNALQHLQALIDHVAVVDKSILFWYNQGTVFRLVCKPLKLIGKDHDVGTIMVKKGKAIQSEALLVSTGFDKCSDVCFATLRGIQSLQVKTSDFVESGIGGALDQADDLKRENRRKKEDLQLDINKKEADVSRVRVEAASSERIANNLARQKEAASRASDRSAALGLAGGFGAVLLGIGCIVCPPAGAIAAGIGAVGAGALGVSSAVVASDHTADARRLGSEEDSFRDKVDSLYYQISSLKSQISDLEEATGDYDKATNAIKALEKQCGLLRDQADAFSRELNISQNFISQGVMKTQTLASNMHRCEYARSRNDFVERVRGVLQDLRSGVEAKNQLAPSEANIRRLEGRLVPLQANTYRVARILSKSM